LAFCLADAVWLVTAAIALAGTASLLLVLFALALLVLQVWMFGRFFVNVFLAAVAVPKPQVHRCTALSKSGGRRDLPWFQRPLWRGPSLRPVVCACSGNHARPQWTTLQHYFNQLATTQDPQMLLNN
jgi:hypothetical protein